MLCPANSWRCPTNFWCGLTFVDHQQRVIISSEWEVQVNPMSSPESLEHVKRAAKDWIDSISRQRHIEVLVPSNVLPKLSEFQPFHSTNVLKPDVTVVTCGTRLPILTVPNICYTRSFNPSVKLIDLDRCKEAWLCAGTVCLQTEWHVYTLPDGRLDWQNYRLDWKAVGLIICFVVDERVHIGDYHNMVTGHKLTKGVRLHSFVKCLLEEGYWDDSHALW